MHHYAAATSLLLENGLIDSVVFTLYDKGYSLDTHGLYPFSENDVYFGGGYNMACLSQSIDEMLAKAAKEQVWAISDMVFDFPHCGASIKPKGIVASSTELVLFDNSRVITLEKAVEKLGLAKRYEESDLRKTR